MGGGEENGPEGRKEKKMSHVARRKKGIPLNVMSLDATWVSSLEVHRREGFTKH